MNDSAMAIPEKFSVQRTYVIFRTLGLRHLTVVDTSNQVTGIITRKDLMGHNLVEKLSKIITGPSRLQMKDMNENVEIIWWQTVCDFRNKMLKFMPWYTMVLWYIDIYTHLFQIKSWIYSYKTLEYDFCAHAKKISQSKHCVQYINSSDWMILEYDYKTHTRKFYNRRPGIILGLL